MNTLDSSSRSASESSNTLGLLTLESVRDSLIRIEDTIIFSLIERAQFKRNSPAYNPTSFSFEGFSGSLVQFMIRETEILHAKVGRYKSPEENAFFPNDLPGPLITPHDYPEVLYAPAASININETIWKMYFDQLLPLITDEGDDGNYGSTALCDLACLQALSKRIHYGKFVAEVKFRDAPDDYEPLIRAKDRDALMKLLTYETVEAMVKRRVEKKAMMFSQEVNFSDSGEKVECKIKPSAAYQLYEEWVMPLTKLVEASSFRTHADCKSSAGYEAKR